MIILPLESLEWCQVLMRTKTPVDNQLYYTMLPLYYQPFKGNAHPFQIYTTLQQYYNKYDKKSRESKTQDFISNDIFS